MFGLDLISATDGDGVQTYHLCDGLGSTTDLTDGQRQRDRELRVRRVRRY